MYKRQVAPKALFGSDGAPTDWRSHYHHATKSLAETLYFDGDSASCLMIDTIVVGCRIDRRPLLNSNRRSHVSSSAIMQPVSLSIPKPVTPRIHGIASTSPSTAASQCRPSIACNIRTVSRLIKLYPSYNTKSDRSEARSDVNVRLRLPAVF